LLKEFIATVIVSTALSTDAKPAFTAVRAAYTPVRESETERPCLANAVVAF
jgi:hypothetical protein